MWARATGGEGVSKMVCNCLVKLLSFVKHQNPEDALQDVQFPFSLALLNFTQKRRG